MAVSSTSVVRLSLLFVVFIAICVTAEARTLEDPRTVEISENQDHERVRRDAQGLFDAVASFFVKDDSGQSPANNLVNGFFKALGSIVKTAPASK